MEHRTELRFMDFLGMFQTCPLLRAKGGFPDGTIIPLEILYGFVLFVFKDFFVY